MKVIQAQRYAPNAKIAIVVADFNLTITEKLAQGAVETFQTHGGVRDNLVVVHVPGAYELPFIAQQLAQKNQYDAIVCLGAVIRGATSHYDYVCANSASGIAKASLDANIPVIFGVITVDNMEQAFERSGIKGGNKGADAMIAALEMISISQQIQDL